MRIFEGRSFMDRTRDAKDDGEDSLLHLLLGFAKSLSSHHLASWGDQQFPLRYHLGQASFR